MRSEPELAACAAEQIAARLQRWYAPLRELGALGSLRKAATRGGVWSVESPGPLRDAASPLTDSLALASEGLALLNALARIDARAFAAAVLDIWKCNAELELVAKLAAEGQLVLGVDLTVRRVDHLAQVAERVLGVDAPTEHFQEVLPWVEAARLEKRVPGIRPTKLRVRLNLESRRELDWAFAVRQLVQLAIAQKSLGEAGVDKQLEDRATTTRLQIVEVRLWTSDGLVLPYKTLIYFWQLAQLGVHVFNLAIPSLVSPTNDKRRMLEAITTLVSTAMSSTPSLGIKSINIGDNLPEASLAPFFSAVQVSTSIESATIVLQQNPAHLNANRREERSQLMRWIAFALFSRHASHKIRKLDVNVSYWTREDVDAINEILESDTAANRFFNVNTPLSIFIEASRFYLNEPARSNDQAADTVWTSRDPLSVRVIERVDNMWWRVLLPGFGVAWVNYNDSKWIGQVAPFSPSSIAEVEILVEYDTLDETKAFLKAIRRGLKSIKLLEQDTPMDINEWCRDVLRDCTELERLALSSSSVFDDVNIILDAALAGQCNLRYLSLGHEPEQPSDNVFALFEALGDSEHPLAKTLEELVIFVNIPDDRVSNFAEILSAMLQKNRMLHSLELFTGKPQQIPVSYHQVAIRVAPLILRSKLAFLSVIHDKHGGVDSNSVSSIFQFAAQHRTRQIDIKQS